MTFPDNEQDKLPETPEDAGIIEDVHVVKDDVAIVRKATLAERIQSGYKGLAAFVLSLGGFLTLIVSDPQIREALPDNILTWLIVVGVPAVVGLGTWLKRNEYTVDEAVEILNRAQKRAGT